MNILFNYPIFKANYAGNVEWCIDATHVYNHIDTNESFFDWYQNVCNERGIPAVHNYLRIEDACEIYKESRHRAMVDSDKFLDYLEYQPRGLELSASEKLELWIQMLEIFYQGDELKEAVDKCVQYLTGESVLKIIGKPLTD